MLTVAQWVAGSHKSALNPKPGGFHSPLFNTAHCFAGPTTRKKLLARNDEVWEVRNLDAGALQCLGDSNALQGNPTALTTGIGTHAVSDYIEPVMTVTLLLRKILIKFQLIMTWASLLHGCCLREGISHGQSLLKMTNWEKRNTCLHYLSVGMDRSTSGART